jgi:hypothetical protein
VNRRTMPSSYSNDSSCCPRDPADPADPAAVAAICDCCMREPSNVPVALLPRLAIRGRGRTP